MTCLKTVCRAPRVYALDIPRYPWVEHGIDQCEARGLLASAVIVFLCIELHATHFETVERVRGSKSLVLGPVALFTTTLPSFGKHAPPIPLVSSDENQVFESSPQLL
jgi:hypothetical protein